MGSLFAEPDRVADSADGTPIGYWRFGEGPAVLALHGLATDHERWRSLAAVLGSRYTVCLMDRRGRNSSGDTLPYALDREIDDVCAVVRDIGSAVVLGHSLAGPIAMEAARRLPMITGVVNYEGWQSGEGPAPQELIDRLEALVMSGDHEGAYTLDDSPETIAELKAEPMWPSRVAAAFTVPRELRAWNGYWAGEPTFSDVETPTLFLMGSENEEAYRPEAVRLMAGMARADSAVIPGQGHQAHRSAPETMVRAISPFLDRCRSWTAGRDRQDADIERRGRRT
jgi:pimeloyl-ACP methyl ester carboxylesterase